MHTHTYITLLIARRTPSQCTLAKTKCTVSMVTQIMIISMALALHKGSEWFPVFWRSCCKKGNYDCNLNLHFMSPNYLCHHIFDCLSVVSTELLCRRPYFSPLTHQWFSLRFMLGLWRWRFVWTVSLSMLIVFNNGLNVRLQSKPADSMILGQI